MLEAARLQTTVPAWQRLHSPQRAANHSSLIIHHCLNQSLPKHDRKSSQIIENSHQRPKSIARFCRDFLDCAGRWSTVSPHPALTCEPAPISSLTTRHSPSSLSNRQSSELERTLTHTKQSATLCSNRKKMQGWREPHDNMGVRLLLLDTPSGTACTGFDQGCKDRARKPFLAVIQ
jgi:hypothetical protein